MNVASLGLCKELYELSGWNDTSHTWSMHAKDFDAGLMDGMVIEGMPLEVERIPTVCLRMGQKELAPAYDLGYLMRKLQNVLSASNQRDEFLLDDLYGTWTCRTTWNRYKNFSYEADTPEDAACKLVIELFKKRILTKEHP